MLVDTNIIVYALNSSSPKCDMAQDFLLKNKHKLFVAHQNVLEAIRILTHPKFSDPMSVQKAIRAVEAIVDSVSIVYPKADTLPLARMFIRKHLLQADQVFDAYLAATALTNGISVIATDNERHFRIFEEITVYNPFTQTSN